VAQEIQPVRRRRVLRAVPRLVVPIRSEVQHARHRLRGTGPLLPARVLPLKAHNFPHQVQRGKIAEVRTDRTVKTEQGAEASSASQIAEQEDGSCCRRGRHRPVGDLLRASSAPPPRPRRPREQELLAPGLRPRPHLPLLLDLEEEVQHQLGEVYCNRRER